MPTPPLKYWIKTIIVYCPECGYEDIYYEKSFTIKPKEKNKLTEYQRMECDYCRGFKL